MQTMRALTIPGLITAVCVGFGCSSTTEGGEFIIPGSSGGFSTGAGGAMGTGNGTGVSTGGTSLSFGGSDGNAGTTGSAGMQGCTGTSETTTRLPPVLQFLIDYSGSMDQTPMGQTLRKYESTRDALIQAFTDMPDGTGTGLIYYPNAASRQGNCINRQQAVPLAPLNAMVRQALITSLQGKMTQGATPTHDAFVYAAETLAASTVPGAKHVVLVTDGSPTFSLGCVGNGMAAVDNGPLVQAVADANTVQGIKTFVIGSPGSEDARGALSQMATQGGTAPPGCSDTGPNYCHFDMTTAPDLAAALNMAFAAITGSIITCNFTIPPPSNGMMIDYTKVNVNFTSTAGSVTSIRKDAGPDDTCANGWNYAANRTQIQLCDDTCNLVKADPNAKVDVVLGCTTIPY